MELLSILIHLGKRGAISRPVMVTTTQIGDELGISQQSVSRWLMIAEREDMISRKEGIRGYIVQITPNGKALIEKTRKELNEVFAMSRKLVIRGNVVTGMGDGGYYVGLKGYREKIVSKLGFKPYPGTLNIQLKTLDDAQYKEKLCAMKGSEIAGFRNGNRTFGDIKCFPCKIQEVKCAVLIPDRSHYGFEVLEITSRYNLRKKLKLKDGDNVKVEVKID